MKSKTAGYATRGTLFTVVLLATCVLAGAANAQEAFQAKFTLPFEAHWGHAVLPAGDYLLAYSSTSVGAMVVICDANTRRAVALEPTIIREDSTQGKSALLVGVRGDRRIVYSLRIAELGQAFVYDPGLARRARRATEEARQAHAIPVLVAKN